MRNALLLLILPTLFSLGCQSKPTASKPTLTRGWIGGEYAVAGRHQLPKNQTSRVYVKQVLPGTPAEEAGLRLGDLVVSVNGESVTRLSEFRHRIDEARPGTRATVEVYRAGQLVELPLTIGRESYQEWHAVQLGFGFSTKVDGWPNPEFSLLPIAQYQRPKKRVELGSAEMILARQSGAVKSMGEKGTRSDEGWSLWFLFFGLDEHKRILSQEAVPASTVQLR